MDAKSAQIVVESAQHKEVKRNDVYDDIDHEELVAKLKESENANRLAVKELKSMKEKMILYQQQYESFNQKLQECVQTHEKKRKALLVIMSDGAKAYKKLEDENEELKKQINEQAKNAKLEEELQRLKVQLQEQDSKIEELKSAAVSSTKKPGLFTRMRQWFGARLCHTANSSSTE